MPNTQPVETQPLEVEADLRVVDDQEDTIAEMRPLPEAGADPVGVAGGSRPELLPTIGHIGRYALKYTIGEGGLGTVYAAHDPLLSRLIAIKTLHVDLPVQDREQFNALFLNEAKAAGSLNHTHIVTVYDAGTSEQGTYIAMELLRGKDLRQLLAMGWKPTPAQSALIVRRVADALSYAHHKGVIHRDIKPANIFMIGRTQPRILDFGIARIRQAESLAQRDDPQSRFQEIVGGSPYYMAPEQVRHEAVDRRVDVYALGVVLYELLVYKRAFSGNSLEEIADAVLNKPVPLAHEVNPAVPAALSEIVARAMHRDLNQRTRSARRLAHELRQWLDSTEDGQLDAGASARGASLTGLPSRSTLAALGGLAAVVGALGLIGLGWMAWHGRASENAGAVVSGASAASVVVASQGASPADKVDALPVVQAPVSASAAGSLASQPDAVAVAAPSPGVLKLAISPWGEVWVDGRSAGLTPPLSQLSLPPGEHKITIRNGDAPPFSQTIVVQAGKTARVKHQF